MSTFFISEPLIIGIIAVICLDLLVLVEQKPSSEQNYLTATLSVLLLGSIGVYCCIHGESEGLIIMGAKLQYVSVLVLYLLILKTIERLYNFHVPLLVWALLFLWSGVLLLLIFSIDRYSLFECSHWFFKNYFITYQSALRRYQSRIEYGWGMSAYKVTLVAYTLSVLGMFVYKFTRTDKGGERKDAIIFFLMIFIPVCFFMENYVLADRLSGFPLYLLLSVLSGTISVYMIFRRRFNNLYDLAFETVEEEISSPLFILDSRLFVQDVNGPGTQLFPEYSEIKGMFRVSVKANSWLQNSISPPLGTTEDSSVFTIGGRTYMPRVRRVEHHGHVYGFAVILRDVTEHVERSSQLEDENRQLLARIQDIRSNENLMRGKLVSGAIQCILSIDTDTGEHMRRTSNYTYVIAKELQDEGKFPDVLTDEYIEILTQVAPLHDLGKLRVPRDIVRKKLGLTRDEMDVMEQHVLYGADLVDKFVLNDMDDPFYVLAHDVALNHHECWDGTGYPRRLRGRQIPLGARIVAVADLFDKLSFEEGADKSTVFNDAFITVISYTCTQFDPDVIDAFRRSRLKIADLYTQMRELH